MKAGEEIAPSEPAPTREHEPVEPAAAANESPSRSIQQWIERNPGSAPAMAILGLFVLGVLYTLYFARDFFLPITAAFFLKLLITPVVRKLRKAGLPEAAGAAVVLMLTLLLAFWAVYGLSGPANDWLRRAPQALRQMETKLRSIKESVESVSRAAEQVEKIADVNGAKTAAVEVRGPNLTSLLFSSTRSFIATAIATIVLLYLLLASGDLFLRKAIAVLPRLEDKVRAVDLSRELEVGISHYLLTISTINVGLGLVMAFATHLLGMPNPLLWGVMVAVLNFIPYLGALASLSILTVAAFVTFDDLGRATVVGGTFFVVNAIEAYVVTPTILGRRMRMNPVAIFVALIFFGWAWGISGLLFAVPILATFKLCCEHIEPLGPVGALLSE